MWRWARASSGRISWYGHPLPNRPGFGEDTSARYARFSGLGLLNPGAAPLFGVALLRALAALPSEYRKDGRPLAGDLPFHAAVGLSLRDRTCGGRDVRGGDHRMRGREHA